MAVKLTVSHEFSGFGDYWSGNGRRWDNDAGCLFAHYGATTTLADCVDMWCDDFCMGGDCDSFPPDIDESDLRAAILDTLTEQGLADYHSGAIAECAAEYAAHNDLWEQFDDGVELDIGDRVKIDGVNDGEVVAEVTKINYDEDGFVRSIFAEVDGKTYRRDPQDVFVHRDDDEFNESPVWIILVEVEEDEDGDEWDLCHHDDGHWLWAHSDGREVGPFDTDDTALANRPT